MSFLMKYPIIYDLLPNHTDRRPGIRISKVYFITLHDTGNPESTAQGNISYYRRTAIKPDWVASAHAFIDPKEIRICIPCFPNDAERAYHVMYDKPKDNELFGIDANNGAIGVELCYGFGKEQDLEAYKRYVWFIAYLCYLHKLDPKKHLVSHKILDPGRKTDPDNALSKMGLSYAKCLSDIENEFYTCQLKTPADSGKVGAPTNKPSNELEEYGMDKSKIEFLDKLVDEWMKPIQPWQEEILKKAQERYKLDPNRWNKAILNRPMPVWATLELLLREGNID